MVSLEELIPNPELDFLNSDLKIHFWTNLGGKSIPCLFLFETLLLFLDILLLYFTGGSESTKRLYFYFIVLLWIYIYIYIYISYIFIYIQLSCSISKVYFYIILFHFENFWVSGFDIHLVRTPYSKTNGRTNRRNDLN